MINRRGSNYGYCADVAAEEASDGQAVERADAWAGDANLDEEGGSTLA